jgi:predicted RNA-binding protein with PIN domain
VPIIIDGYNLLGTCGFIGPRGAPGMLERARNRLLGFLAQVFSVSERGDVTVVFDSAVRLPDTPDYVLHNGIHVHFATGHRDADEMIIDMLLRHSAPKSLLIVSSDHQIQQAAQRRRARFVDSDKWYDQTVAANRTNPQVAATAAEIQLEVQLELKEMSAAGADPDQTKLLEEFSQSLEKWVAPQHTSAPASAPKPAPASSKQQAAEPSRTTTSARDRAAEVPRRLEVDSIDEQEVAGLDLRPKLDTPLKHGLLTDLDEDQWLAALDREFEAVGLSGGLQPVTDDLRPGSTTPSSSKQPSDQRVPANVTADTQPGPTAVDGAAPVAPTVKSVPAGQADPTSVPKPKPPTAKDTVVQATGDMGCASSEDTRGDSQPFAAPAVSGQQVRRWNRQLAETDVTIFPPGYGEDVLFSDSFEIDDRLKKKRRPGKS